MGLFTERDEETPNEIIIGKLNRIEAKLDAVIKALHEYDDDNIYSGYDEPNEALLKAAGLYNEELNKKYGESSFEAFMDEEAANKRMDVIGQNGNEGTHYVTNEEADEDAFNDYGMRVDKDKSNNIQPKQKQYYKNSRSKRNGDKKSAVVEHVKHPPHKH